jgi:hypothetical protein
MLQPPFAFPPINLSRSDRAAKQSPGLPNGFFQFSGVKPIRSAFRACSGCDDVPLRVSSIPGANLPECSST